VLARVLEAQGVATTAISMVREHSEKTKPPRALFVPFPFGHALGRPDDPALQHRVLAAALALLAEPAGPVLRDLPDDAEPGDQPAAPAQASGIAPAAHVPADVAGEVGEMVRAHARWLASSAGRTAFGISGVPVGRLGEAVQFLDAFANGKDADLLERRPELPLPGFIRYCADDLKAVYFEGRLATKPTAGGDEIARWFWSETAVGQLLRRVRDRLDASDDPRFKAAAFGVAR
jgi:hypothetical protein